MAHQGPTSRLGKQPFVGVIYLLILKMAPGAEEMTLQLRTLAVLPEDPGFDSQHPCDSTRPSVTIDLGDSTPSFGLHGHQTCT